MKSAYIINNIQCRTGSPHIHPKYFDVDFFNVSLFEIEEIQKNDEYTKIDQI